MKKWLLLFVVFLAAPAQAEISAHSQQDNTLTSLVSAASAIVAGQPLKIGLLLEAKDGWHTYWENPGDAGMATNFTWTLPPGFTASAIDWPAPQRMTEGPLVTFSYLGKTLLPVTITPPATLDNAAYPIKLKAEWLVCKDICVPESAELQITLPVAHENPEATEYAPLFNDAQNHVQPIAAQGAYSADDKHIILSIPLSALPTSDIKSALFFPREQNIANYAAEQSFRTRNDSLQLIIERASEMPQGNVSGIVNVTDNAGNTAHYNVVFAPASAASATASTQENLWFPTALLFALIGGLVLNLMPCVLPVLSLKALAIAKKSDKEHKHVVLLGIAYTLGILVSFTLIAGLLIALRQAGESIGWGYQMQSPAFVGFLIYLLFMVGLSLSGLFHLPVLLGGIGGATRHSLWESFFTGVLATMVATPCTAPFMASAIGAALTLPALQSLLIFEALGLGLALPFLLISVFPHLLRFLPKPGAWMETFKQLLAFPMYASAIWLIWVLTLQTGAGGTVLVLTSMLAIVIILWMKSLFSDGSNAYRIVAILAYGAILMLSLPMLSHMEINTIAMPGHAENEVETIPYSKEKLAELRAAGTPVFIDATAAWCITCQLNARVALHTERTMAEFKKRGIVLMIADWTRRNDDITEFLSGFGYKGVPLCVYYPKGGEKPVVLPQILTENVVINALNAP